MADFRLCSTCRSCSQANFYHYALQLISDQFEFTFARFRYSLGNHRPNETTHRSLFLGYIEMRRLSKKGWYLKDDLRLPPILHNFWKLSMIDYSKGARVLPSFFKNSASARRIQFHWVYVGDSGAVVTPFMRVTNYVTRNFARGTLVFLPP